MSNLYTKQGIQSFRIDKRIVRSGALARLSGDTLRLFLFVSHEIYWRRKVFVTCTDGALRHDIRLSASQIALANQELSEAGLMLVTRGDGRSTYAIATEASDQTLADETPRI